MENIYRWKIKSLLAYLPVGLYFGIPTAIIDVMVISVFRKGSVDDIPLIFWFLAIAAIFMTLCSLFIGGNLKKEKERLVRQSITLFQFLNFKGGMTGV